MIRRKLLSKVKFKVRLASRRIARSSCRCMWVSEKSSTTEYKSAKHDKDRSQRVHANSPSFLASSPSFPKEASRLCSITNFTSEQPAYTRLSSKRRDRRIDPLFRILNRGELLSVPCKWNIAAWYRRPSIPT